MRTSVATRIGDLCAPTATCDPRSEPKKSFQYIDIASIDNDKKAIVATTQMLGAEAPSRARKKLAAGDVLVSTVRPNLNAVALVPPELDGEVASTGFCILRPLGDVLEQKYLFYWTQTCAFIASLLSKTTGAHYPAVSDAIVKDLEIPLPPLSEQRRIVEILDQADALRKRRAEADTKAQRILPSLFNHMFGDPASNNNRWPLLSLGDITEFITDGTHQPPPFTTEGIPFLFVQNIVKGSIDFDTQKYITEEIFEELTRRRRPQRDDILYSTVGSYGVAVLVNTERPFSFQRHIGHIRARSSKIAPFFLCCQMNMPFVRNQADLRARGIAQKTLNLGEIREFQIRVPALENQQKFCERAKTVVRSLQDSVQVGKAVDTLFTTFLHSAFTGDLTAKWRETHIKELLQEMVHQTQ